MIDEDYRDIPSVLYSLYKLCLKKVDNSNVYRKEKVTNNGHTK